VLATVVVAVVVHARAALLAQPLVVALPLLQLVLPVLGLRLVTLHRDREAKGISTGTEGQRGSAQGQSRKVDQPVLPVLGLQLNRA